MRSAGSPVRSGSTLSISSALGECAGVRDHDDLARPLRRVYPHGAEDLQLGRRHVIVSGPHDLVDRSDALRPISHRRNGLRAPGGMNLVYPKQSRHSQHPFAHAPIPPRRRTDDDLLDASHPRRYRRHYQRTRISDTTGGSVDPGPPDRTYSLSDRRSVSGEFPGAIHLSLVEQTHVLDGDLEALLQFRGESDTSGFYLRLRHADGVWPHPVETLGVLQESLVPPHAHVLDDAAG